MINKREKLVQGKNVTDDNKKLSVSSQALSNNCMHNKS